MAHQISKYPLTADQIQERKLPGPPKLFPVFFKKCRHSARLFEDAFVRYGSTYEIDARCWNCPESR